MKAFLQNLLPNHHPLRLLYHKVRAVIAALWYRFPANHLTVIAVTGTNGKTTTANLIHSIFQAARRKSGLITTVNFKVGDHERVNLTKQTTPSPFLVQRLLREMVDTGCTHAVIEVTSHALIQSRTWGINVDTAVFTNLTQDHLDYHGSMEAYKEAKGRLFRDLNVSSRKPGVGKLAVVNMDDLEGPYFSSFPVDQLFEYGIQKGTYVARNLECKPSGTKFQLRIPNGEAEIVFKIPGRMNVYNALAAATVAVAHHIQLPIIKEALEKVKFVPGRLELIEEGQPFHVLVDYAHTPDALEQLLGMLRELTLGRLIVVFGATGDRDKTKRPIMGEIVDKYADVIILTDDDPYTEDHEDIAKMVRAGIRREEGDRFWQVLDRREAMRLGISLASTEQDTVVIAGKGAEAFQVVGTRKISHDDRQVAREILGRKIDIVM